MVELNVIDDLDEDYLWIEKGRAALMKQMKGSIMLRGKSHLID